MARNSQTDRFFGDLALACMLLTRIPMPIRVEDSGDVARSAWAWPLVGAMTGALAGLGATLALAAGLPPTLSAALALAISVVITGALHEDGLADTADGFWGGHSTARRLEIMRDSRIGSYGVLALIFAMLTRWAALSALFAAGWVWVPLIVAGATSRAAMVVAMHLLNSARADGLSHSTGRPGRHTMLRAVAISAAIALVLAGVGAIWIALITAIVLLAALQLSRAKIGGQTGDTLGATQQVCEIAILLSLVAMAG